MNTLRSLRGGSFVPEFPHARAMRCATRYAEFSEIGNAHFGLRPVSEAKEDRHACVVRGGSWIDLAGHCRNAFRYAYAPGSSLVALGFRPVAEAKEDKCFRAMRGSSWHWFPWACRSAFRFGNDPGERYSDWGLRPVAEAEVKRKKG